MKFKEEIYRFSSLVLDRMQHISNEEMTKQALVIPFLQMLGYDVFNPLENQNTLQILARKKVKR